MQSDTYFAKNKLISVLRNGWTNVCRTMQAEKNIKNRKITSKKHLSVVAFQLEIGKKSWTTVFAKWIFGWEKVQKKRWECLVCLLLIAWRWVAFHTQLADRKIAEKNKFQWCSWAMLRKRDMGCSLTVSPCSTLFICNLRRVLAMKC